ncbi:MAG: hypothetical protein U0821_16510 [Chloroflexota bacterium]
MPPACPIAGVSPPPVGTASTSAAYDQANRLVQVASGKGWSPHVPTTLTHDGDGKRTRMQVENHVAVEFRHFVSGGLPMLLDDGNDRYVWGPNGLAYQVGIARPQPYVMHADGQGNIRAITEGLPGPNQPAMVLRTIAFDEFGAPIAAQTTSAGTAPLNQLAADDGSPNHRQPLAHLHRRADGPRPRPDQSPRPHVRPEPGPVPPAGLVWC